jgi:hypothetical protein
MTTLTIGQDLRLQKTHFKTLKELFDLLYEDQLEQKMQKAKKIGKFVNF